MSLSFRRFHRLRLSDALVEIEERDGSPYLFKKFEILIG